jgi:hypothetical protein
MIGQLVRTKFESNLMSFIVFVALIGASGIRYMMIRDTSQDSSASNNVIILSSAWLMVFCLVAGGISLLRQNRERSSRLYAQLPVSPRQIRMAYWLHASLYAFIAALALLTVVLFAGTKAASDYLLLPPFFFFDICVLLACFSLVTSNISRLISERVRRNTVLYGFVVVLATLVLGNGLAFISATVIGQYQGPESLAKYTLTLATVCVAMVALDIYLFGKQDHNLG